MSAPRAFVSCFVGSAVLALAALAALATSACSGAAPSDLFGEPSSDAPTTSTDGTNPPPAAPGDGQGPGSVPGNGPGPGPGGGSGSSGSGGSSSGGSSGSSGSSGAGDAGTPPWKSPGIKCGDVYCVASAEVCCARLDNEDTSFACKPASQGCGGLKRAATLKCDDQTDCPNGQLCCAAFEQGAGYRLSTCATSCQQIQGATPVRLCDLDNPKDECATSGRSCEASQGLPGYGLCR